MRPKQKGIEILAPSAAGKPRHSKREKRRVEGSGSAVCTGSTGHAELWNKKKKNRPRSGGDCGNGGGQRRPGDGGKTQHYKT